MLNGYTDPDPDQYANADQDSNGKQHADQDPDSKQHADQDLDTDHYTNLHSHLYADPRQFADSK